LLGLGFSENVSEYLFSFYHASTFKVFGIFVNASLEMRNSAKPGNVVRHFGEIEKQYLKVKN